MHAQVQPRVRFGALKLLCVSIPSEGPRAQKAYAIHFKRAFRFNWKLSSDAT